MYVEHTRTSRISFSPEDIRTALNNYLRLNGHTTRIETTSSLYSEGKEHPRQLNITGNNLVAYLPNSWKEKT